MTQSWRDIGRTGSKIPREPLDEATRARWDLPRAIQWVPGDDVVQRPVFDPSLKHYQNAFRATDPSFPDPEREAAWRAARRRTLHLVLTAIAESGWADALVLRGSVLMSVWFGEAAREPGDLDFVVVPHTWRIGDPRTGRMLEEIAAAAARTAAGSRGEGLGIAAAEAVTEDIWTYDRVPGRRLVLPWTAPELPGGYVQLDFVFNEHLPEEPRPVRLPDGTVVKAASPELSLAWKLMWLINDLHAQGKDLYDAVLLAERHPLPYPLLHEVFRLSGEWPHPRRERILLVDLLEAVQYVEWEHFATEYPELAERGQEFADRLVRAVRPAFPER